MTTVLEVKDAIEELREAIESHLARCSVGAPEKPAAMKHIFDLEERITDLESALRRVETVLGTPANRAERVSIDDALSVEERLDWVDNHVERLLYVVETLSTTMAMTGAMLTEAGRAWNETK